MASCLYTLAIWLVKLAVLLLFLRLFPKKRERYALYLMVFWITGQFVAVTITLLAGCSPFSKLIDATITTGHCINKNAISISTSGMNVAIDFIILALPLPTVWSLNLPRRQKWALLGVFMMGAL